VDRDPTPADAPSGVTEYHFHLYFTAETRASAVALREQLAGQPGFAVTVGALHDAPVGPHLRPQFLARVPPSSLEAALRWYMFRHGEHPVLLHPDTRHDRRDHTAHALWLGERLDLDESKLDPT
jgi:aromatic ring-cleaving dioxygenase